MMNDTQKLNYLLAVLKETADRQHVHDASPEEYSPCGNGNYDAAFEDGTNYGEIAYARDVLKDLELEVKHYNSGQQAQLQMNSNWLTTQENRWFDVLQGG